MESVSWPWFRVVEMFRRDPSSIHRIDWRMWEEIVAGAYKEQGFDVVLTPRSNDKGRDVIATHKGIGSVRFFDQVKAYGPMHLVTADHVRAMMGVLTIDPNVSKGVLTTTSGFAPGILADPEIARFVPYRLELKDGPHLLEWLESIALKRL